MHSDSKKRIGLEFVQRLGSKCDDAGLFKVALEEFASSSPEKRRFVAEGLLAVGADRSETTYQRNYALSLLSLFARTCGLRNDKVLERQLNDIIDEWVFASSDQEVHAAPWGALLALGQVNRNIGLKKCDHLIKYYEKSEVGRRVHVVRKDIERLNSLEI